MARLSLLLVATTLAVLSESSAARAETPGAGPGAVAPSPLPGAVTSEGGSVLPGGLMRVLDVLAAVGIAEIDRSSTLLSSGGVSDDSRLSVRGPTWVSPEPPKTPLLYSRVMQLKF